MQEFYDKTGSWRIKCLCVIQGIKMWETSNVQLTSDHGLTIKRSRVLKDENLSAMNWVKFNEAGTLGINMNATAT